MTTLEPKNVNYMFRKTLRAVRGDDRLDNLRSAAIDNNFSDRLKMFYLLDRLSAVSAFRKIDVRSRFERSINRYKKAQCKKTT